MRPSSTCEPAVSASSLSSAIEFSASTSLPVVQTLTSTTRSSRSWRYSTSVMSVSSVDMPATRRSERRSSSSSCSPSRDLRAVRRSLVSVGSDVKSSSGMGWGKVIVTPESHAPPKTVRIDFVDTPAGRVVTIDFRRDRSRVARFRVGCGSPAGSLGRSWVIMGASITRRSFVGMGVGGLSLLAVGPSMSGTSVAAPAATPRRGSGQPWVEAEIATLQRLMSRGRLSSQDLTAGYLERIADLNPRPARGHRDQPGGTPYRPPA